MFWIDIKYFVFGSLDYGLKKGKLSVTQREGIITLVPKPGKPKNMISGWRPITLLNSTYKILAETFANKIKTVLNSIIHTDQTAFLKTGLLAKIFLVIYLRRANGNIQQKSKWFIIINRFPDCIRCNELEVLAMLS